MTDFFTSLTLVPVQARFCLNCSKRLAAMNGGHHCYACEAVVRAATMNSSVYEQPGMSRRASAKNRPSIRNAGSQAVPQLVSR